MLLGKLIEHGVTEEMFLNPEHRQTADYIEGRYG
jgi:ABC-type phosphate transport system ATPase subunit